MKKKVFSLMMTLLLAFVGMAKAEVVTIGEGTSTYYYYPVNMYFNYSLTEELYTPDEIGTAGTINAISFYYDYTSPFSMDNVTLYMKNVTRESFSSNTDLEPLALGDIVWTGTFSASGAGWVTITLDTPFAYDGTSNLLVAAFDGTSGYPGSAYKFRTTPCTGYKGVNWYSDTYTPDPYNLASGYSGSKYYTQYRANIQLDITPGGGGLGDRLHVKYMDGDTEIVDRLDLGVRPLGCWTEPFEFQMYTEGPTYTVNVLDFTPSDGMFSVEGEELPFQVVRDNDVDLVMGVNAPVAGVIDRQFVAITEGDRAAHIWPVTVEVYDPLTPDVWEKACTEATTFPFVEVPATAHNVTLHNDYTLPFPEIPEGYDAVYKLVFANDMMLNASVTSGQNGKVALYREGFEGEGGPMATNSYNGPMAGGGAAGAPFEAQIGEGTSTFSYFPFYTLYNYTIAENLYLATELAEAGVTTAPMTSLSWYATNTTGYNQQGITIWMANVEDAALTTTSHPVTGMTKVYTGAMTPLVGWNEFVFNEGTFSWDGHSNVLIYVQRNNGTWNSTISWQATGSMPFNCTSYRYQDSGAYDPTVANTMYTSTTRPNIIMKADGRNRDAYTYGFESGLEGWTVIDVNSGEGTWVHSDNNPGAYDYTTLAHGGTGFAMCYSFVDYVGSYDTDSYLVSPQKYSIANGANITFWADNANDEYPEWFGVCVSTSATPTASSFTQLWGGEAKGNRGERATVRRSHDNRYDNWRQHTVDLSAYAGQDVWIAFHDVNYDMYEIWIDDVTVNAGGSTPTPGPTPTPTPSTEIAYGPVITNAAIEAGTYYLVASSTDMDFEVTINAEGMPCPAVEGFAFGEMPADDEDEVEPASVTLKWNNPAYATEYQVVFGSTYHPEASHPQTVISDWTPVTGATGSFVVRNLWNNTNYFWHVVFRNAGSCPEGVSSPIWGFTTHLNVPQNLTAVDETVFNDEQIVLNWTAVVDRTFRTYNVYRDGELIGSTQVNNIGNATYTDGPLAYNMAGYTYYVTAIYDEGESAPSNTVNVKVSGYGDVNGHVYEQDGTTGIAGATVTMVGQDEFGVTHTYNFITNGQGYYSGHIYAGSYNGQAACNGYQTIDAPVQGNPIAINYNETTSPIDYILDENFDPVCTVIAEYYPDSLDPNSPYVKVYWGCGLPGEEIIEDFETGDFSMFDWQLDNNYPWSVTTYQPYEGTYCMKSGGAGVANVVSNMTVTVEIPADGIMSFFGKISCENNWDYGYFYIDGQQKGSYTGASSWGEKKFDITAGTHTFMWQYTKDGSVNSNDDCFYVDYINFYKRPEPVQAGWHTYAESEFNNAVGSNVGTSRWAYEYPVSLCAQYAGFTMTKVSLFSDNMYSAVGGNYTCTVYAGGNEPMAGTAVSTITVDVPANMNDWVDFDLTTPVPVSGTEALWVVWTANTHLSNWPAGCCDGLVEQGTWWSAGIEAGYGWEHTTYGTWTMRQYFNNRAGRGFYSYAADNAPVKVEVPAVAYAPAIAPVKGQEVVTATCANPNAVAGARIDNNTRSLDHYNVYRTNCYNDGPYTEENTVFLATVWVPDTVYIDVEWYDLPAGVYKWGVSAVYVGNRGELYESSIAWGQPVAVNDNYRVIEGKSVPENNFATVFSTGDLTNYMPNRGNATVILTAGDVWGDGSGYQMLLDADANAYGTIIPETGALSTSCSGNDAIYAQFEYKIPANADGNCSTSNIVINNSVSLEIPAGTYDWCITNPTPGDRIWIAASTGNVGGRENDYVFEEGMVYEFVLSMHGTNDGVDVTITSDPTPGPTPGPTPTPVPGANGLAEPRQSEIVWSNCLDKDMYLADGDVTINVLLNSADNPEGTTVDFLNYNEAEQELYPVDQLVLDETGYYVFPEFRRGDYQLTIRHEGYETIIDSVSIWDPMDLRYVMIEIIYGIDNLYVSRTGWAMWDAQGMAPTPGPGPQPGQGSTFNENFDGGIPAGWTTVDADGDGYTWVSSMNPGNYHNAGVDLTGNGHNASAHFVLSGSWINQPGQALTPDNYLVSPQVTLAAGSTFSFWACAQDAGYPADHFGVAISDNGTSNWTMVNEWTMTAKSAGAMSYGRNGEMRAQGNWYNYTVDLSAYAGQKYIAIRHFNCTDQFILNVDDIELTNGAKSGDRHLEYFKVMCESLDHEPIFNIDTEYPFCQVATDELVEGEQYLCKVAAVYSTGMSAWTECIWQYESCEHYANTVNGLEIEGNTISWEYPGGVTPGPQPGQGSTFSENCDNGMPAGWTTVDADGDGYTWVSSMNPGNYHNAGVDLTGNGHNASAHFVLSGSWINQPGQALTPDNYLVSPQVTLAAGSTFSFWACAQDAGYPADHFGVAISDNGTSDWTMVNEWTMTAKSAGAMSYGRNGEMRAQGNWYNYSVDLSAYAGQKYIAIRHFNCTDQFILNVDDIELTSGSKSGREVVAFNGFVTDPGAMANGADASWIKGTQSTYGPGCQLSSSNRVGDVFTLSAATTINEIEVYGYQTGSSTTSTFNGLYVQIYDGNPMNGGNVVWGDANANIMTATAFTNCYRGSDGDATGTTRPIMSVTAGNLNIELAAGTYYLVYQLNGTGSSGPWATPHAEPGIGNTGNGVQFLGSNNAWQNLSDSGNSQPYGCAMKITGNGGTPGPTPTPGEGNVLGAMVFADGEWEAFVPYPTNEYTYEGEAEMVCVRMVYDGTAELPDNNFYYAMSCGDCEPWNVGPIPGICEPGAPIHGEVDNVNDVVKIWWGVQPAPPMEEWLYYDDGVYATSVGTNDATATIYWATMFPAESLAAYAGTSLTKAAVFQFSSSSTNPVTVTAYLGGTTAPGTAYSTTTFTPSVDGDFEEVNLDPVAIDGTQNLWIVCSQMGAHPANACADSGEPNNRWISLNGTAWQDLAAAGLPGYGWLLRGFVTNQAKGVVNTPIDVVPQGNAVGELSHTEVVSIPAPMAFMSRNRATLVQYNVYRSTDNETYTMIGSVAEDGSDYYEYLDTPGAGNYYYQVRAQYDDDCESDPAPAYDNPTQDYVEVAVTGIGEMSGEVALFPNPTKGNVTIQAAGMTHVTVVSVLGQVVYDAEVAGDELTLNMSQYNAGMYTVRITTTEGIAVRRVTVVR